MSSTGISNFDCESSSGFITDVSLNGYGMIAIAIERMLDPDERPGLVECEEALLAAEFISATLGKPSYDFPEEALDWIVENLPGGSPEYLEITGLAEKAADAIDLIVTDSELRDMWEEQPDFEAWFQAQVDLQNRILG